MITWEKQCMTARVRVLALRALVSAGGPLRDEQLVRAVEPVLGDLLPLPSSPAAEAGDRQKAAATAGRWAAIDAALTGDGASLASGVGARTVVMSGVRARGQ